MLPLLPHVAQRRERIGGLARLRHQQAQAARRQWRRAVAELARHIAVGRDARHRFEPPAPHQAGIERAAAGRHGDPRHRREIEWQLRQRHRARRRVDHPMQRVADHLRVFVQLLLHEVAEIALADRRAGQPRQLHLALDFSAAQIEEPGALPVHHRPVAIMQIGDAAGQRRQRQRVGAEIHLILAKPHRQRRTMLCADDQLGMAGEDHRQRIGTLQPAERRPGRLHRRHAAPQIQIDELRHRLGIGLGAELLPLRLQLGTQFGVVLDDAVMHHGDARRAVRMRVVLGRCAVRRPTGVADAGGAGQRRALQCRHQVAQLAFGAAAVDVAVHQGGDAGAVVAAIFQAAQRLHHQRPPPADGQ